MKFGTSGLRGLVAELVGASSARYATAFGRFLLSAGHARIGDRICVAGDFRPSTPGIMATCMGALERVGLKPVDCGFIPTPALALYAMANDVACLMVTGSHIPADRNGIKFYTPQGEISKSDELAITALADEISGEEIDASPPKAAEVVTVADALFLARNRKLLERQALLGLKIGIYQHSTVARDAMVSVLTASGAEIVPLGRSERFIPVDTEAVSGETIRSLQRWAQEHALDAIVSADGDGDRPLVADETGEPVRGDLLGLVTAQFLNARVISTPVTSSSGIEGSGPYAVHRTKVGSPFVIESMLDACRQGQHGVMGFEANGGVLTASTFKVQGETLQPLPTRDSFLPILAILSRAAKQRKQLSAVVTEIGLPVSLSDRLENFPLSKSVRLMAYLQASPENLQEFLVSIGQVLDVSHIDGVRVRLVSGSVLHFRPSGNAPEMRCYVEAPTRQAAAELLRKALILLQKA